MLTFPALGEKLKIFLVRDEINKAGETQGVFSKLLGCLG